MKLADLFEMPEEEIISIEDELKQEFKKLNINLVFSTHFNDRMIDDAVDQKGVRRDNITKKEFLEVFYKLKLHHDKLFKDAADHQDELKRGSFEGVIRDTLKMINVPFALTFKKNIGRFQLTCKTIMKKKGFHSKPSDHVIDL